MNNVYLLPALRLAPAAIAAIVRAVPESGYDKKVDPERFSLREAVCHIADYESINLGRMQAAIENPGGVVLGIDEGELAITNGYARADIEEQLARIAEGRRSILAFLESVGTDDWKHTVVHNEKGEMTLYDQANLLMAHDTYHIEHLTRYLSPSRA